ncbi:hypothetical protein KQX54_019686 [Cotesia glomerata]|uniref:Uncharacterized protein n=1 Tax=Cotesia glomerata TaxID=32391 RepID=A0AAV7IK46_COTGL|nr:hypothetical protein KQX54_019686 [Cotesia glomerata]
MACSFVLVLRGQERAMEQPLGRRLVSTLGVASTIDDAIRATVNLLASGAPVNEKNHSFIYLSFDNA